MTDTPEAVGTVDTSSEAVERVAERVRKHVVRQVEPVMPPIWLLEASEQAHALVVERDALLKVARAARGLITRDDFWRDEIFASVNNPIPGEYDSVIDALDDLRPGLLDHS